MMLMQSRFVATAWRSMHTIIGIRFSRFAGASIAALLASTTALSVCDGLIHLSSTWSALVSWLFGAAVSYTLSRWAWGLKGKPNMLRETLPFLAISVLVVLVLSLATKLGYGIAADLHLHGARHVAVVELVYVIANFCTFLLRFAIFDHVLFKDSMTMTPRPSQSVTTEPSMIMRLENSTSESRRLIRRRPNGHRSGCGAVMLLDSGPGNQSPDDRDCKSHLTVDCHVRICGIPGMRFTRSA